MKTTISGAGNLFATVSMRSGRLRRGGALPAVMALAMLFALSTPSFANQPGEAPVALDDIVAGDEGWIIAIDDVAADAGGWITAIDQVVGAGGGIAAYAANAGGGFAAFGDIASGFGGGIASFGRVEQEIAALAVEVENSINNDENGREFFLEYFPDGKIPTGKPDQRMVDFPSNDNTPQITNEPVDETGFISFATSSTSLVEGGKATIKFHLTKHAPKGGIMVFLNDIHETAVIGEDYIIEDAHDPSHPRMVIIPEGVVEFTVNLISLNDAQTEQDETITLKLEGWALPNGWRLGDEDTHELTLLDDDFEVFIVNNPGDDDPSSDKTTESKPDERTVEFPSNDNTPTIINDPVDETGFIWFAISETPFVEEGSTANVEIFLTKPAPEGGLRLSFTIDGTAHAHADVEFQSSSVFVPEGETKAVIPIRILEDADHEADEILILSWYNNDLPDGWELDDNDEYLLTILENDAPNPFEYPEDETPVAEKPDEDPATDITAINPNGEPPSNENTPTITDDITTAKPDDNNEAEENALVDDGSEVSYKNTASVSLKTNEKGVEEGLKLEGDGQIRIDIERAYNDEDDFTDHISGSVKAGSDIVIETDSAYRSDVRELIKGVDVGIRAVHRVDSGRVDIYNSGAISDVGIAIEGISERSYGDVDIDNEGEISGAGEHGIFARHGGGGDIYIDNDGEILTAEEYGILAEHVGDSGRVYVNNRGTISDVGIAIGGTSERSYGGVEIYNRGEISGARKYGIFARHGGYGTHIVNRGIISGVGEYGILAEHFGDNGSVYINNRGTISDVEIAVGGTSERSYGRVEIYNRGKISGARKYGIFARHGGYGIHIGNRGIISGVGEYGILAEHFGDSGRVHINNRGIISDVGIAIRGTSEGDSVEIYNRGEISGAGEYGILAEHVGDSGRIDIYNYGKISNVGIAIKGINEGGSGDIDIASYGEIWDVREYGIFAEHRGAGDIDVFIGEDIKILDSDSFSDVYMAGGTEHNLTLKPGVVLNAVSFGADDNGNIESKWHVDSGSDQRDIFEGFVDNGAYRYTLKHEAYALIPETIVNSWVFYRAENPDARRISNELKNLTEIRVDRDISDGGGFWAHQNSLRSSDDSVHFGFNTPALNFMSGGLVVSNSISPNLSASLVEGMSMSNSIVLDYHFDVMEFSVSPQIELAWTRFDFDDFTGPGSTGKISLEDGDIVTGRLGLLFDGDYIYGGVNLRTAIDGKTSVNVSGVSIASEQDDLSVDGLLGFSYDWGEDYETYGELFMDADEVRANLGVRVDF